MTLIDCFQYHNEKELLELRINLLYDKVDHFYICEADHTHSGIPKEFTLKTTLKELGIPTDKITILEISVPGDQSIESNWIREHAQRDIFAQFIVDDVVAIIADLDEIVNPDYLDYYISIAKNHPNNILRIVMDFLLVRADLQAVFPNQEPINWSAAMIALPNHVKKHTLSHIRQSADLGFNVEFSSIFVTENNIVPKAGWHFSWMGDIERLHKKFLSMPEKYKFDHNSTLMHISNYKPTPGSVDPLNRSDHLLVKYNLDKLPKKIFELPRVKEFLLPQN